MLSLLIVKFIKISMFNKIVLQKSCNFVAEPRKIAELIRFFF